MNPTFLPKIFGKNMKALKGHFPELHDRIQGRDIKLPFTFETIKTPCGQFNITATLPDGNPIRFYDDADTLGGLRTKMADWQLEAEDFLFCIGLGSLPLLASQKFAGKSRIVVIEPNPEVMRLALQFVDPHPLLAYERLGTGHMIIKPAFIK
jgi:hypothetical protein